MDFIGAMLGQYIDPDEAVVFASCLENTQRRCSLILAEGTKKVEKDGQEIEAHSRCWFRSITTFSGNVDRISKLISQYNNCYFLGIAAYETQTLKIEEKDIPAPKHKLKVGDQDIDIYVLHASRTLNISQYLEGKQPKIASSLMYTTRQNGVINIYYVAGTGEEMYWSKAGDRYFVGNTNYFAWKFANIMQLFDENDYTYNKEQKTEEANIVYRFSFGMPAPIKATEAGTTPSIETINIGE